MDNQEMMTTDAIPQARYTPKQLKHIRDQCYAQKLQWWNILEKTYRASQPNRDVFYNRAIGTRQENAPNVDSGYQGRNIAAWTYDLTLAYCTRALVSKYVNLLFPIGKQWGSLVPGFEHYELIDEAELSDASDDEIMALKDNLEKAKKYYQKRTDKLFRYLHMSNFDMVNSEALHDMVVSTGTYTLVKGTTTQPFLFDSVPPDTLYLRAGPYGTIDAYFRDFIQIEKYDAEDMWPGFNAPVDVIVNESTGEAVVDVFSATFYQPNYVYNNKTNEYEGRWLTQVLSSGTLEVCWEKIEKTCPYITYRETRLAGEVYGRGTALMCMPAAATLDVVMQNEIKAQEIMGNPMWMAAGDGILNPHTFVPTPGAVVAVNMSISGTFPIQPLSPAGMPQLTSIVLSDIREQISRMMLVDPFDTNGPQKTATEITLESNLNIETASPNIARINYDCVSQLFPRMIEILQELGLWHKNDLLDGKTMAVRLQLPSEISQGVKEVRSLRDAHAVIAGIYGADIAAGFFKIEKTAPFICDRLNVYLENVTTEKEIILLSQEAEEAADESEMLQLEAEQKK